MQRHEIKQHKGENQSKQREQNCQKKNKTKMFSRFKKQNCQNYDFKNFLNPTNEHQHNELQVISSSNAVIEPFTMMIEHIYTPITLFTVETVIAYTSFANLTHILIFFSIKILFLFLFFQMMLLNRICGNNFCALIPLHSHNYRQQNMNSYCYDKHYVVETEIERNSQKNNEGHYIVENRSHLKCSWGMSESIVINGAFLFNNMFID